MGELPVAIVGGGPAGSAAAIELRRSGHSVIVFERSGYDGLRIGESVPPSAHQLLTDLGLPQTVLSRHGIECQGIWSAWGSDEIFEKSFIFSPYGHGWHVDRRRLDESLAEAAESMGADVLRESKITSCAANADGHWTLTCSRPDGSEARTAAFVIDAGGRSSILGKLLGAERKVYDHQVGVAQIFAGNGAPVVLEPVTMVESVENGWWYSAPLPEGALIVVYLTDADLHPPTGKDGTAGWTRLLAETRYTSRRVGGLSGSGELRTFMADTYRVRCESGLAGWLNAGAAAIGVDPLSSDGICLALRSGRDAARAAVAYLDGDASAITDYSLSLDEYFDRYLEERSSYHRDEMRWPESPYWSRRHAADRVGN